jgi:hypothetical protein
MFEIVVGYEGGMGADSVEAFGQTAGGESFDFLGSANGVADADACEAVDFGEGPRNDYTIVVDRIVYEGGVIRCCTDEVMVSLVDENRSGGGNLANEFFEVLPMDSKVGKPVMSCLPGPTKAEAAMLRISPEPQPSTSCSGLMEWD